MPREQDTASALPDPLRAARGNHSTLRRVEKRSGSGPRRIRYHCAGVALILTCSESTESVLVVSEIERQLVELIEGIRRADARNDRPEADRLLERALSLAPNHPLVMNEAAMRSFASGD